MVPDPLRLHAVRAAVDELSSRDAVARMRARDAGLWSDDPGQRRAIAARLGWLDVAAGMPSAADRLRRLVADVRAAGLTRVVLAGMGGSSLAPEVFARVFPAQPQAADLTVLDSTHPAAVRGALDVDLSGTLVVVSSKSGTTEETRAFAAYAATRVPSSAHLLAITDSGSALHRQAQAENWRACLCNPADIGGRYSALSYFGMLPAALLGVDVDGIWQRAEGMLEPCLRPEADNPGLTLGAFMGGLALAGRDKLTLLADPALVSLGDWIEQLVAESTGKRGRGIVPVVDEPVGAPEDYAGDRAFVAVCLGGALPDGAEALARAGQPLLRLGLADRLDLGAEFVRWEVATALAGALLGVNPFDEPNVAESKANTRTILAGVAAGRPLPAVEDADVAALLAELRPGDYVSLQLYLPPSEDAYRRARRLRRLLRDRLRVATTFGWGPRFLHSTGQLHKGGPDTVVSLQVVDAGLWQSPPDEPVPGLEHDLSTLVRAQAVGDLRSLRGHGRRVAQVAVRRPEELDRLAAAVDRR